MSSILPHPRGRRAGLAAEGYTEDIIAIQRLGSIVCFIAGLMLAFPAAPSTQAGPPAGPTLGQAHHHFYSGRYEEAAAMALELRKASPEDLETFEARSSSLHFLLKRLLAGAKDKKAAMKACASCTDLLAEIKTEVAAGRALAKARLEKDEQDDEARFLLGKIDLTHVWLHLETLGQRTGWSEYWEARKSLDRVLERHPDHVRARVSRAWIDYIVDTRVPRGLRWVLGGGDRKGAVDAARKAAAVQTDLYTHAEAAFALWEMLQRDGKRDEAVTVARGLFRDFPDNRELARFLSGL